MNVCQNLEGSSRNNGSEVVFEEIMVKNFPQRTKDQFSDP